MGWLSRLLPPSEPSEAPLRKQLRELRDELDALHADFRRLRAEWAAEQLALSDLVAKMTAWVGRLAARERKKAHTTIEGSELGDGNEAAAAPLDPRLMSKGQLRGLAAKLRKGG